MFHNLCQLSCRGLRLPVEPEDAHRMVNLLDTDHNNKACPQHSPSSTSMKRTHFSGVPEISVPWDGAAAVILLVQHR